VAGCPPCQPFSSLTHGDDSDAHQMAGLVDVFNSIVSDVAPDIVEMRDAVTIAACPQPPRGGYDRVLSSFYQGD
jgi:hypothetical protein